MKRILSIGLIGLFVLHGAGFYIYFAVRLTEIRKEMRHELSLLPSEELTVIEVDREKFQPSWLDEKEMEWKGEMYDIARVEITDHFAKVYCLHDEAEVGLLAFINTVIDTAANDKSQAPPSMQQFLSLEFLPSQKSFLYEPVSIPVFHSSKYSPLMPQDGHSITAPPPRT